MATVTPQNNNSHSLSLANTPIKSPEIPSPLPCAAVSRPRSSPTPLTYQSPSTHRKMNLQEDSSSSASMALSLNSISSTENLEHGDLERYAYEGSVEGGDLGPGHIASASPPDGGYGWVCVVCVCLVNACTSGLISAYGIYLAYFLSHNLHPTATPYHYAFLGGVPVALSNSVGPVVSFLYRRGWTTSQIMFLGAFLQSTGLLGASCAVDSLVGLFLTQGVACGLGVGFLYSSSVGTISQWFSKKRCVANGIAAAGSGVGGLCFTIGVNKAIENLGVGWSFRLTAIVVAVVNLTAASLIRDRNAQIKPTQRSFDYGLINRIPNFRLVLVWGYFSLLGYVAILFSMADYAHSVGLSASQGSIATAILCVGMLFGRPCIGFLSDTYGRMNISAVMTVLSAATVLGLWMPAGEAGFWLFVVFALFNGAVCGTFWATISPLTAEVVGLKELPSALSLVWFSIISPSLFGEVIVLALKRPSWADGGFIGVAYLYPQVWASLMYLIASGAIWVLRARLIGAEIEKEVQQEREVKENREGSREGCLGLGKDEGRWQMISMSTMMSRWRKVGRWWRWTQM